MKQRLYEERKGQQIIHDHTSAFLDEENELLKHISPVTEEDAQKYRADYRPGVPLHDLPASDQIPQTPERQLDYDHENETYRMAERPSITDETKNEIAEKHNKFPGVFNKAYLAKTYGISADEIHTILFEHELKHKYQMFTPDEVTSFREQQDGEDKKMARHAYLMNAYSEILAEKSSKWMPHGPRTDIEYQEDHKAPHEYYTKKILRNVRKPNLNPEEAFVTSKEGPGSGLQIPCESWQISQPLSFPYLITDIQPKRKIDWRPSESKVRERDGRLRWTNLDELNWVKFKEMHPRVRNYKKTKNITAKTRLLFKGILEPLSYHYRKHNPPATTEKVTRYHNWWGMY